jgi:hypothetical protein
MRKAFEAYRSFEEWVSAHKHSTPAIYSELETSLEAAEGDLPQGLKFYIIGLEAIRSEIDAEIFESGEWIEYFEKQKG